MTAQMLSLSGSCSDAAAQRPSLAVCLDAIVLLFAPEAQATSAELAPLVLEAVPASALGWPASLRVGLLTRQIDQALRALRRDGVEARCRLLTQRLPTTADRLYCLDLALAVCQQRGGVGLHQTGILLRIQPIFELSDAHIDALIERYL